MKSGSRSNEGRGYFDDDDCLVLCGGGSSWRPLSSLWMSCLLCFAHWVLRYSNCNVWKKPCDWLIMSRVPRAYITHYQWRIQDFSGGALTFSYLAKNFPKTSWKLQKLTPWIRHWLPWSIVCTEAPSQLQCNKSVHLHAIWRHRISNVSYNYRNQTNLLDWLIEMSIITQNAVRDQPLVVWGHVTNQNSTWSNRDRSQRLRLLMVEHQICQRMISFFCDS